jgi:hypothetical protein
MVSPTRVLLLLAVIAACCVHNGHADYQDLSAVEGLINRLIPEQANRFYLSYQGGSGPTSSGQSLTS